MSDHFLSDTPVSVAIESLERQVEQLKRIIHTDDSALSSSNEQELKKEISQLRIANEKAEYRIKMLLKALEARDKQ